MSTKCNGKWSTQEHEKFIAAKKIYKKWKDIAKFVETRNSEQCRYHNQKMEKKNKNKVKIRRRFRESLNKETQTNEHEALIYNYNDTTDFSEEDFFVNE